MSARKPSHLVRRGDIFYFRSAIPAHARALFSRLEIKVSLRTTDRRQATLRQRWLSYLWEDLLQAVRSMAVTTPFRIDQAVQQYFREQVDDLALQAAEGPRHPSFEIDREVADANQFLKDIRSRIASRQYSPLDVDRAEDVLKKSSLDIPPVADLAPADTTNNPCACFTPIKGASEFSRNTGNCIILCHRFRRSKTTYYL